MKQNKDILNRMIFKRFTLYKIIVFLILLLAIGIRIYNFNNRWGLGSDDIRDVSIAKQAILRHELPLIGSFSSAGPFVFGPLFYYFIMISYLVMPFFAIAPWILLTISGILVVICFLYIGFILAGPLLSIILGLLVAVSPQFVNRSMALNQHSLVGVFASFLLLFALLFVKRQKKFYAFLMGICIGVALGMHYQAINLLIFFFVPLLFLKKSTKNSLLSFCFMIVGFLIPLLPLIIWDSQQSWANLRNILDYMLIAQNRLYVPNSWKLFLFNFLIPYWSYVVGGNYAIATLIIVLLLVAFLISLYKKKMDTFIKIIVVFTFIMLLVNRYYKGERFEGYMMYIAPLLILLSGWSLYQLFTVHIQFKNTLKLLVVTILVLVVAGGSLLHTATHVLTANNHIKEVVEMEGAIINAYPKQKLAIYDFKWKNSDISYPLSFFLKEKDRTNVKTGIPIGIINEQDFILLDEPNVIIHKRGVFIVKLVNSKNFSTYKKNWTNVNQTSIYDDLMQWTKTSKLQSTFLLDEYIKHAFKMK